MARTTVVLRPLTDGPEPIRILDELERLTGLLGLPAAGGRSYELGEARDFVIAMASIKGQLDGISPEWDGHLAVELDLD